MIHCMKLNPEPYYAVKEGRKTIELRLNDEKRQQVKVGDFIEFSLRDKPSEKIQTRVTALHSFGSFEELYESLPLEKCGYASEELENASAADMEQYYPKEEQAECGVLGIEIRLTDLQRFLDGQAGLYPYGDDYDTAIREIRAGDKSTHWMWYVFPQIKGIGTFGATGYFSIKDIQEAEDYYYHPVLGGRLIECSEALLALETSDPVVVFGSVDAFKLRSCMTLFSAVIPEETIFRAVLDKFCLGIEDDRTTEILEAMMK